MEAIEGLWERHREKFVEVSKGEFDRWCRGKQFVQGPVRENLSSWMKEYGPYNPDRWAFGELDDGRFVCAKVAP